MALASMGLTPQDETIRSLAILVTPMVDYMLVLLDFL